MLSDRQKRRNLLRKNKKKIDFIIKVRSQSEVLKNSDKKTPKEEIKKLFVKEARRLVKLGVVQMPKCLSFNDFNLG